MCYQDANKKKFYVFHLYQKNCFAKMSYPGFFLVRKKWRTIFHNLFWHATRLLAITEVTNYTSAYGDVRKTALETLPLGFGLALFLFSVCAFELLTSLALGLEAAVSGHICSEGGSHYCRWTSISGSPHCWIHGWNTFPGLWWLGKTCWVIPTQRWVEVMWGTSGGSV